MLFVVLCPGTPEGSTGSGSGFKASQKTGQQLKVSSDRLGETGIRSILLMFSEKLPIRSFLLMFLLLSAEFGIFRKVGLKILNSRIIPCNSSSAIL